MVYRETVSVVLKHWLPAYYSQARWEYYLCMSNNIYIEELQFAKMDTMNLGMNEGSPLGEMSSLSMSLENIVKDLPGTDLNSLHLPLPPAPLPSVGDATMSAQSQSQSPTHSLSESHSHSHEQVETQAHLSEHSSERRVLLVAAGSRAKQVAGSIAQTIRESTPPLLSAVGPGSVNQAVKAIAIARTYLEQDNLDISCSISHKPGEKIRDLIHFTLTKHPRREEDEHLEYEDLKSSAKSRRGALAGAIANNIREEKRPRITSIGKAPVFQAVTSIVKARKYLGEYYDMMNKDMTMKS